MSGGAVLEIILVRILDLLDRLVLEVGRGLGCLRPAGILKTHGIRYVERWLRRGPPLTDKALNIAFV